MKKRSMKKLISLLLVLLMVMAFPLQPASADTVSDPNVELTLVTGTTNLDVSDFAADVKAAVYEIYGIPGDRLNINIAGTTVVDQKNDFDWITYDHYYAPDYPTDRSEPVDWSVYHSVYQPYFYYPETYPEDYSSYFTSAVPGDVSMSACYYRSKHIYTNGSDLIFLGYSAPAFKDFMVFPDQTEGEKTIEFGIDESGVSTHTLEGAGFLFNTSIIDNKINGYLVYYNYQNGTIELYQLTNVDASAFHQEEDNSISSLQIPGIRRLAGKDMPGQVNQGYAAIRNSTKSPLKVFADGGAIYSATEAAQSVGATKNIKVQVTANSLKFYEDGVAIYDTTGADSGITIQDTGAGGFGPLVGYSSHGCSELSYFTFKDLAMVSTRSVSFMDVLNEQAWSPNSKRVIVNLDDDSVPEFSDGTILSQVASQLAANTVHYLGWGHNLEVTSGVYNKDQAEQLIAQNNNKGMFINLDDPNYDTYDKSIAAIAQYINMVLTPEPDTTPPTIGTVTPSDGANVYSVNSISVALSDAGDGVNAAGSIISVVGRNSGSIPGSVAWTDGTLSFTPTNTLTPDTYTVTITVADNAGNVTESVTHFTLKALNIGRGNVQLTLVTGTTNVNFSNFAADVQKAVYDIYGIPGDRLNITKAGTNVVDTQSDFNWTIYDHYYAPDYPNDGSTPVDWSVYHSANQPYFYWSESFRGEAYNDDTYFTDIDSENVMDWCYYRSKHIYAKDGDLTFLGYSEPAFKDFMVYPDQNVGEKTIEFAIDETGVSTHTLEGAGFLFNTSIVNNLMNGYLVFYNYQYGTIDLYKLTNVDADAFHQEEYNAIADLAENATTTYGLKQLAPKAKYADTDPSHQEEMKKIKSLAVPQATTDGITLLDSKDMLSDAPVKNIKVQVTANSLKFYEDGAVIYDTTGIDSGEVTIEDTGAGGFGPLVSYESHGCNELSYFTFKDLAMVSEHSVSFTDVMNEQNWSDGSKRIIVNLDDDGVPEFSDSQTLHGIAAQLKANNVHYIGWGRNLEVASAVYNKDQVDQLIALNNQNGMFINMDDPNSDTYEEGIAAIAQYINMLLADNTPPIVGQITPADGANVYSVNSISVPLSDSDAGVNPDDSNITIVGNKSGIIPGSVAWAGGILSFTPAKPLAPDTYTVTVTVADNAGNVAESIIHFTVSPQPTGDNGYSGGSGSSAPSNPPTPAKPKVSFTDMVNHWAQVDVEKLATDKFVYGYPDGTFKPDNLVTRAEFAAILFKVFEAAKLKQTTNNAVYFSDVSSDAWYYDAVNRLAPEGIIMGYGDDTFGPDKLITREEAASMLTRMVTKVSIQVPDNQLNFKDNDQISQWAKDSVRYMISLEIIKGMPDGTFQPVRNATRSETAVMILRLTQKAKLI